MAAQDGLLVPGNIDLQNRPRRRNPDGSISTVRSISIGNDQGEVLIPTIADDGSQLSDDDAVKAFYKTGKHLGVFTGPEAATAAGQRIHNEQAAMLQMEEEQRLASAGLRVVELPDDFVGQAELETKGVRSVELPDDFAQQQQLEDQGVRSVEVPWDQIRQQHIGIPPEERSVWKGIWSALKSPAHAIGAQIEKSVADDNQLEILRRASGGTRGGKKSARDEALEAELGSYASLYPKDSPVHQPLTLQELAKGSEKLRGEQARYTQLYADAQQEILDNAPDGPVKGFMYDAAVSVMPSLVLGGLATATTGPAGGMLALTYLTAPGAAMKADEAGVKGGKKLAYIAGQAGAEVALEAVPIAKLLKTKAIREAIADGSKRLPAFGKYVASVGGTEAVTEAVTQLIQDGLDIGVLKEDMTLGDVLKNAAYAGTLGAFGGGAVAAPVGAAEAVTAKRGRPAPPVDVNQPAGQPLQTPAAPAQRDLSASEAFGAVEQPAAAPVESAAAVQAAGAAQASPAPESAVGTAPNAPPTGTAEAGAAESAGSVAPAEAKEPDLFEAEQAQRNTDADEMVGRIRPPGSGNGMSIAGQVRNSIEDGTDYATDQRRLEAAGKAVIREPGDPLWKAYSGSLDEKGAQAAVAKWRAGEKLGKAEQNFIDHALEFMRDERAYQKDVPEERRATDDDYRNAMLEDSDRKLGMLAQRALEMGVDRDAVEEALDRQSDELAHQKLTELIGGITNATVPTAAADQTPAAPAGEARSPAAEKEAEASKPSGTLKLQRRSGREKDPYTSQNGMGFTHWAPEGADLSQYGPRAGELEVPASDVDLIGDEADGYRALGLDPDNLQTYKDVPRLEMIKRLFERPGAKRAIGFSQEGADGKPEWEYALRDDFVQARRGGGAVAQEPAKLDDAAHQAATSPKNDLPEPTEAQAKAGNYQKGHVNKHGLSWTIENPAGSTRPFTRPDGTKGERTMQDHYGYIRGTEGKDGDHIDAFFGPGFEAPEPQVLAINQIDPATGKFDEVKLMVGYGPNYDDALEAYYRNYQPGWRGVGSVVETDMERVKAWLDEGNQRGQFPKSRGDKLEVGQGWVERPGTVAAVEEAIRDDYSDAWVIQRGKGIAGFEEDLKAAGWKRDLRTKGKHNWMKGEATLFLFSQGDLADPIVQFKAGDLNADPDGGITPLEEARSLLTVLRGKASEQGRVVDDRLMERVRRQEQLVKELEATPGPEAGNTRSQPGEAPQDTRSQPGKTEKTGKNPVKTGKESAPKSPDGKGEPAPAVSANTIFTEDAYQKARALLKAKLGQVSSGLDPELVQAGITLAGYHIEKGARTFAAYSKAMIEDLGEAVRPYLRSWYEAVRYDPRATAIATEMTPAADIQAEAPQAPVERVPEPEIQESAPAVSARQPPERQILTMLRAGDKLDKRKIQQVLQPKLDGKALEEAIELAIVLRARELVDSGQSDEDTFQAMQRLYSQQPNLSTRTSTSVEQQAYSTPAPLAYLASRLADVQRRSVVVEPTAGNGMLLIEATPRLAVVNELNPDRAEALKKQGFKVTREDATTARLREPVADVVIANPPFGTVRLPSGITRTFEAPLPDGKSFSTNEIDHAISMRALMAMAPKGRAVLIIGSVNKQAKGMARSDAYNGAAKRQFFYHLYQNYNVVDQFTVAGELYAKQGAAWPVDVIVINGRGKSARKLPAADVPRVYDSWQGLRGLLTGEENATREGGVQPGQEPGSDRAGGSAAALPDDAGQGRLPERVEQPAAEPVVQTAQPGDSVVEPAGAAVPARPVGRSAAGSAGPGRGGQRAGAEQPADVGTARAEGTAAEQPAADRGEPGRQEGGEERPEGSSERARELAGAVDAADLSSTSQVPYNPASVVPAIGTLVPTNMRDATANALAALEARVGKVESYVAKQLGWAEEDVGKFLGAEQVDGVALAIDQISQNRALVIGDQTGVGKGRQVAALIRFALRQGKIPVFVTEKPNLYADMYRDLNDIGQEDIRPLVTNSSLDLPLNDDGTVTLKSPTAEVNDRKMQSVIDTGELGDHNMVFTTYNQMQTVKGKDTVRMRMLNALGPRAMLILDESHNAGGQEAKSRNGKKDADGDAEKTGRAGFVRGLVNLAQGVLYSSATWAKRPDVMDLYSKTDMALAVDSIKELPGAILRGGVPLQQAVASMLAKAGQYIRREKSFAGIEYNTPVVDVDLAAAEDLSSVMLAVREFDTAKESAIEALKEAAKAEAKLVSSDGTTGAAGAQSTNFTSVMHNLIDQMLLALKAQAAVDSALKRRAEGKKVVITVSNTMGSFIGEYAHDAGLTPGDAINLSFADLMMRYLEKSRDVIIKDNTGRSTRRRLTDEELGRHGLKMYKAAKSMIESAEEIGRLPVSPIDYIHSKLREAGVKSGEITGRSETIDYSGAQPIYRLRPGAEVTPAGRKRTINAFNRGEIDMLVLNQAGATGLSLHASEKFKDKTQRWMVLAQAEKNIDTHMQMLGRINRTGQVETPGYDQITANIPAEKRPAAVLAKKMASLNANTTAARGSAVTSKETVDFLNVYGDEVVAQLMSDMPDVHEKLGEPLSRAKDGDGYEREEAARRVTGRIPLLPVAEQEALYEMIEDGYKAALAQADAMGENALEAKTLDLDARPTARTVLFEGKGDSSSPFAQGAYLEEVNVKRLGKPYTSDQVKKMVMEELRMEGTPEWGALRRFGSGVTTQRVAATIADAGKFRAGVEAKLALSDLKEAEVKGRLGQLDGNINRWKDIAERLEVGHAYRLSVGENVVYGVLTKVSRKKGVKLPVALGAWEAQFAIADSTRTITLPFSRLAHSGGGVGEAGKVAFRPMQFHELTQKPVLQLFDDGQSQSREDRVIVTGNLLAGFAKVKGGAIVNYTTNKGEVKQGILMPRNFDLKEFSAEQPVELTASQIMQFFRDAPRGIVENATGALTVRKAGSDYVISVPKSKADGGKYYLDRRLTEITKDFVSKGDRMVVTISSYELPRALNHLESTGEKFQTKAYTVEARAAGGKQMASSGRQVIKDDAPMAELGVARVTQPRPVTNSVKRGLAIRAALDAKFGPASIKALVDKGLLRIVATFDNLPEGVQQRTIKAVAGNEDKARDIRGVMDPKTGAAYIVAANTDANYAVSVLLHEIGEHYGLRKMLGEDAYHRLQQDIRKLRFTDPVIKEAWAITERQYPHEHPGTGRFVAEVIARLADDARVVDAPWYKRVLWAIRRFLWQYGLTKVDAADVKAMLVASVRKVIQDAETTPPTPPAAAAPAPAPSTDLPQASLPGDGQQQQPEESPDREAQQTLMKALTTQPIDRSFRTITARPFGRIKNGKFVPYAPYRKAASVATAVAKSMGERGYNWMHPSIQRAAKTFVDTVHGGLGDRVGTPEDFKRREDEKNLQIRSNLLALKDLGKQLMESVGSQDEARALQSVLTGERVDDEAIVAVAAPIRDAIEDMGRQLVELGFLTAETWERNKGKYLHRSYLDRELERAGMGALAKWAAERGRKRRARIQGDIFRGRGIFDDVTIADLKKSLPEDFWGSRFEKGKVDVALKNSEWVVLDQVREPTVPEQTEALGGNSGRRTKVIRRIYWPADEPIPNRFAGYTNRGTYKVRDVQPGKVTLWRDYTAAERERMGEVLDARYNIVKTYSMMIHDLANGQMFRDIAKHPEWATRKEPKKADGSPNWAYAAESLWSMTWNAGHANDEWVKVPVTRIGGEGGPHKYGALAGMYVKAPIWRDMAQFEAINTPGYWKTVLSWFKVSKTALSPTVHVNNIISNVMLADLQDIRARDVLAGFMSMAKKDEHYQDALRHGVFGTMALDREIDEEILKPLLKELADARFVGPLAETRLIARIHEVLFAGAKFGVDKARRLYELEDEIFRMASYRKLLSDGMNQFEAAQEARRMFIDYDIRAPWINAARATVLPFISYTYRAIPLVAKAIKDRPWKLAKYYAIAYGLQTLFYAAMDEDDEERERYERLMDSQYQGLTWLGLPRMMRMPWNDQYDNAVFLDVRRWIPAADIADTSGEIVEWMPAWLQVGGPLLMGMELAFNNNAFRDEKIWEDTDTKAEAAMKAGAHVWAGMMPNFPGVPGAYATSNILDALGVQRPGARIFNRQFEHKSLVNEIAGSFGIKLRAVSIEGGEARVRAEYDRAARELSRERSQLNRSFRLGNISDEDYLLEAYKIEAKQEGYARARDEALYGPLPD